MTRPRVLWVTGEVPDRDGGGGAIRQANLLAALSTSLEVDLLVAGRVVDPTVRAAVGEVIEVPVPPAVAAGRWRALWEVGLRRRPLHAFAAEPARRALAPQVAARAGGYDVVVLHHEELLPLVDLVGAAARVLHLFDVKWVRATQAAQVAPSARSALVWRRAATAAKAALRRRGSEIDLVVTCTDDDAAAVVEAIGGRTRGPLVVPNGVDLERFAPTPAPEGGRVLFLGSLDYDPNVDGVRWFVDAVWPQVCRLHPDARLTIAGHRPGPAVQALAGTPGVDVVGAVPSAPDCLAEHDVVVVPLRIGSGSRLKALEAMASGRAVVGTTIGLEGIGIDLRAGATRPAVVADGPAAFATEVARLLADPVAAARLGAAGRAHVEAGYGWATVGSLLAAGLAGIVEADADQGAEADGVAVVVCTRGRPVLLAEALGSIAAALTADDELLVVEADGTGAREVVAGLGVGARHLVAPEPGKSRQLNQGLRSATRSIVVLTDDDCRVAPGWVAAMAAPFADPTVGVVFGNVSGLSGVAGAAAAVLPPGPTPAVTWEYANGAAMAVRRSAALAVGGYDERLGPGAPAHGEEHDLTLRLLESGWQARMARRGPRRAPRVA